MTFLVYFITFYLVILIEKIKLITRKRPEIPPDPVCERTTASLPDISTGIVCFWTLKTQMKMRKTKRDRLGGQYNDKMKLQYLVILVTFNTLWSVATCEIV